MTEVGTNAVSGAGGVTGRDMRELSEEMKLYLDWGLSHVGVFTAKVHRTRDLRDHPFLITPLSKMFRRCNI